MTAAAEASTIHDDPMAWIELLAGDVGPRRPTSDAERLAARRIAERLRSVGLEARLEHSRGIRALASRSG